MVIVVSSPVVDGASALLFQDGCEIDQEMVFTKKVPSSAATVNQVR